jgi:hypothetical protein
MSADCVCERCDECIHWPIARPGRPAWLLIFVPRSQLQRTAAPSGCLLRNGTVAVRFRSSGDGAARRAAMPRLYHPAAPCPNRARCTDHDSRRRSH